MKKKSQKTPKSETKFCSPNSHKKANFEKFGVKKANIWQPCIYIRISDKFSRNFGAVNVTMISMKNQFILNDSVWYQLNHSAKFRYFVLENTTASGVALSKIS